MVHTLEAGSNGGSKMTTHKLKLEHISHAFRNGKRDVPVLRDISLTIAKGEFVTLIGPSGSGKSTIFNIIGGLITPTSGSVLIDGRDVAGEKGNISYMPQQNSLLPWRTIEDNVILAQEIAGARSVDRTKALDWLDKAGLSGYEKEYPSVLSGGMRQRVAFIRALLSPQELMLLDEPFGALDELTRLDMQRWLLNIWDETNRSVLFITHSIEEAIFLSDRIYVLSDKPATILKEITIPFQRPRDPDLAMETEFVKLKREIYNMMKEN